MAIIFAFLMFLYGVCIGSFLNVCIHRLPKGESVVTGGSHCPSCGGKIKYYDLIPLVSWLVLGGECRLCGEKISARYPLVELTSGVLFVIVFLRFGLSWETIYFAFLSSLLLFIAVVDGENGIIPDGALAIAFVGGLAFNIYRGNILNYIIGFFAASLILYIIALISKGGLGGGDIKMMAAFGFCIGWQNIIMALFIASLIGSAVAVWLMAVKRVGRKYAVPFAPFLSAGIFISALFGERLLTWYVGLF
ncbi:MAG: Type 4 prepilin-like proteins leader peptide-processing enzyme [Firmicutes bacterium ADurb.Bin193]|nr:MAG: Type 4 prepilin-like proteins leader peptide-processing enzyme [Firmicutes bacterium ADurb.Bin193]